MIFDELDKKMRIYEQSLDQVLLPEIYMVFPMETGRCKQERFEFPLLLDASERGKICP